ncbi:RsmE family RNA methyltransferase [Peptoniphilus sp.]|uniref:RsmE family RNA methyltransferase n=1 Tax=Peptoniphilus sp. TaxID=1971214 RepID=UPI0039948EC2
MFRVFQDSLEVLSDENRHHLLNVVRLNPDEEFEIVASGKVYRAIYDDGLKILREVENSHETRIPIHLYMALIKQDKFEIALEKTTEVGVTSITPVIFKRTVVNIKGKEDKKLLRWQKILESAAKQSKRDIIPTINSPEKLENIDFKGTLIVPYECAEEIYIDDVLKDIKDTKDIEAISILIGPEGGFEESEIEFLKTLGCNIVTLGTRILRAETAAIVACYQVGINEVVR